MTIGRNNYEVIFIDYFDGKLAPGEVAELLLFLEQNPDLKEEFEDFENISLPEEEISYPRKSILKKNIVQDSGNIDANNYSDYFIAFHEGDLNEKEKLSLTEFLILNPELKKEFNLYGKLKLTADKNTIYNNKRQLKRKAPVFSLTYLYSSAVAAVIILLIGTWFFLNQEKQSARTDETEIIASVSSLQLSDKQKAEITTQKIYIPERKEVSYISNPEPRIEKTDIFRMESLAMEEKIVSKSPEAYMPRLIYQRYNSAAELHELYAEAPGREKTLAGKIISNAAGSLVSVFRKNVEETPLNKLKEFSVWDLAEAGIAGYNALADREVVMFRKIDKNGRLVSVAILGENMDYRKEFR